MYEEKTPIQKCETCKHSTPHTYYRLPTGFHYCRFGPSWKLRNKCDIERWEPLQRVSEERS